MQKRVEDWNLFEILVMEVRLDFLWEVSQRANVSIFVVLDYVETLVSTAALQPFESARA